MNRIERFAKEILRIINREKKYLVFSRLTSDYIIEDNFKVKFTRPVGEGGTTYSRGTTYSIGRGVSYVGIVASPNQNIQEEYKNPLKKKETKDWEKFWGEKRRAIDLE